jgi:4-amino-4-deoxy-L-arabinose transferase-like glycosyltransferase
MRNPDFFYFFFVQEHFARFAQTGHHRPGAWYYYAPVVLIGTMPWTSIILAALPHAWREPPVVGHRLRVDRLLLLWIAVIIGFFSFSSSKLPGYVIPAFPALALLAARWIVQTSTAKLRTHLLVYGAGGGVTLLASLLLGRLAEHTVYASEATSIAPWLALAGFVSVLAFVAARAELARGRWERALVTASLCSVIALQIVFAGAQNIAPWNSVEGLIAAARARVGEFDRDAPFYSVDTYDQTLPLQLGRTVTLVNYTDEMALGLRMEPDKGIPTLVEFRQRWHEDASGYAMMRLRQYEDEVLAGTAMQVLARDARYVLVQKPWINGVSLAGH